MSKLAEPNNVRYVHYRNCANCHYRLEDEEAGMYCRRDDGNPWGDEIDIHNTVCDGFKRKVKK